MFDTNNNNSIERNINITTMDPKKEHNSREGKNRSLSTTTTDSPIQRRPPLPTGKQQQQQQQQQYDSSPRNNNDNNNSNNNNNNEKQLPYGMINNTNNSDSSSSRGRSGSAGGAAGIGGGFLGPATGVFGGGSGSRPQPQPVLGPAGTQLLRTPDGGVAMAYLIPAAVGASSGSVGAGGGQGGNPFLMTPSGRVTDFIDPITGAIFGQSASSASSSRHASNNNNSKNNIATAPTGDPAQLIQTLNFALQQQQQHQQHRNRLNQTHPKIHDLSESSSNRSNREERHNKKGSKRLSHHQHSKRRSVETIEIDTTKEDNADDNDKDSRDHDEIIDLTDREDGDVAGYSRRQQHQHKRFIEKLSRKESKKRARGHHQHPQRSEGGGKRMYRSRSEDKLSSSSKKRKVTEASPKRKPITINDDDDEDEYEDVGRRNANISDLTKQKDDNDHLDHEERKRKGMKSQPAAAVENDNNSRLGIILKILRGDSELARNLSQPVYVTMEDITELSRRINNNNSDSTTSESATNTNSSDANAAATTPDVLTERRIQDETIQSLNKQHAGQLSLIAKNEKIIADLQQQIEMNKSYPLLIKKQAVELDALRTKLLSLERSRLIREKEESLVSNEQQRILRNLDKIVHKLSNELKQEKIRGEQGINAFVQASNKSFEILRESGHYLT